MSFEWNKCRNAANRRVKQTLAILNSKTATKNETAAANKLAAMWDMDSRRVESAFNKIATRYNKRAFMQRFKTPLHTLSGKYTPTAIALLEYCDQTGIKVDRWILAQAELIKQPHFNLYMCFGENAEERYKAWEQKQDVKFVKAEHKANQTNSKFQEIQDSIVSGHMAALSWIPQLKKIKPPSLAAALFWLLPNIQGWYCLCYEEFRSEVMEGGLCDAHHMIEWYNKLKRSPSLRQVMADALRQAEIEYGKLEW